MRLMALGISILLLGGRLSPLLATGTSLPTVANTMYFPVVTQRYSDIQPYISSITPSNANPGDTISIAGYNFGASQAKVNGSVIVGGYFGGLAHSWSEESLSIAIPNGVALGNHQIQVVVSGIGSNLYSYTVGVPPTPTPTPTPVPAAIISGVSPNPAIRGGLVTIMGSNFGPSQSAVNGSVFIGGYQANIQSWTENQILSVISTSAMTGTRQVSVMARGQATTYTITISAP